ncbi:MAG: LapA family protein [Syntrophobacterales bacterium]|nr:LapA family protein [Syntrophobacterales bacterium]OPX41266.1 MAG: hypothetical protein B1H13_03005 [Desulfobacteraceae bacterium 4484_190.3]
MKLFYTVVGMLVILFIITFSLTNTTPVHLKYYNIINFEVPSYLLIFISFGVGLIFAGFLDIVERLRLARKVSKLNKRIKVLEKSHKETEVLPPVQEGPSTTYT